MLGLERNLADGVEKVLLICQLAEPQNFVLIDKIYRYFNEIFARL